jgi:hypothetical protein
MATSRRGKSSKASTPQPPSEPPDERETWLRQALADVEADLATMRSSGKTSMLPALHRVRRDLRTEIDELLQERAARESARDEFDGLDDDQLLAIELEALRDLPPHLLEPLAEVVIERLGRATIERLLGQVVPPRRVLTDQEDLEP